MKTEEQKREERQNKIITILFVAAFTAAPAGMIGYGIYDHFENHTPTEKKQEQTNKQIKTSLLFLNALKQVRVR